jgi:hypothetical protein
MNKISWINVALGVWLAAAGFALAHATGNAVVEDVITGLVVALGALWAARAYRPFVSLAASWTVGLTGLWIVVAPFALGYGRPSLSVANDIAIGLVICALAWTNVLAKAPGHTHRLRKSTARAESRAR